MNEEELFDYIASESFIDKQEWAKLFMQEDNEPELYSEECYDFLEA